MNREQGAFKKLSVGQIRKAIEQLSDNLPVFIEIGPQSTYFEAHDLAVCASPRYALGGQHGLLINIRVGVTAVETG